MIVAHVVIIFKYLECPSLVSSRSRVLSLPYTSCFVLDYYGNSIRIMLKEEKLQRIAHFQQKDKILLRSPLGDFPLYYIGLNYNLPICKKG